MREEYAIILDFLASGYSISRHREPVAQAIGERFFSLLEVLPKEGVILKQEERVYIGHGKRDKIKLIKRRLKLSELTNVASTNLDYILEDLIRKNEKKIVEFFNTSAMLTPRMHRLELLPGIGKKYVETIIKNRPYSSFDDIAKKTELSDIIKMVKTRILSELGGDEKYYIFTMPMKRS